MKAYGPVGLLVCSQQIQLGQTLSQLAFHVFQCFAAPADCTPTCSTPWPLRGIPVSKSKVLRTDHMILAADMVMIMLMLMTNASKLRTSLPLASCWTSQAACIRAASGCLGNREKRRNVGFGRIGTKPWKLKHLRLCKYENSNLQTRVKVLPGCGTCKQSVRIQALSRKGSRKGWNWGITIINKQYFTKPIPRGKALFLQDKCYSATTVTSAPSSNCIVCSRKVSNHRG